MKNTEKMRISDAVRERVPWKEMKVGGIYQRKDGRYYIYAGRSEVFRDLDGRFVQVAESKYYTYIYLDWPGVLVDSKKFDTIQIIASSARIRSAERRDIARSFVGMLPEFDNQECWKISDYTIYTDPTHEPRGTTSNKVDFSEKEKALFAKKMKRKVHSEKSKRAYAGK